uniref:C3H1-type domain-containing protein n=1 Tax=Ditylum brightwellii TaxID=49249 RepID=A0A6U3T390_9STRA|mmetsp:Transcript_35069/g.52335  ORF Transcript_35069/g.52335 Transcript_35069/m.52335 type:complete len:504 (+) Transcript_35069:53-1564(+)
MTRVTLAEVQEVATTPRCVTKPTGTPSRYTLPCGVCAALIVPGNLMFPISVNSLSIRNNSSNLQKDAPVGGGGYLGKGKKKTGLVWAHNSCGEFFGKDGIPNPPPCRHWTRLGRCPVGEAGMCAFSHNEADKRMDLSLLEDASKINPSLDNTHRKKKWGGRRAVVRNDHKNAVFRAFLMQTYGLDFLRFGRCCSGGGGKTTDLSPSVILDVAGGKGELSWEIINLMGVESVVVDPRGPLVLRSMNRKWKRGMYEPKRTGPVFRKWCPAVEEGSSVNRDPQQPLLIRCFFDADAFVKLAGINEDLSRNPHCAEEDEKDTGCLGTNSGVFDAEDWLQKEQSRAKAIKWTTKGLTHESEDEEEDFDHVEENNPNFTDDNITSQNNNVQRDYSTISPLGKVIPGETINAKVTRDILRRCSLVVGLHPDQAVGDIVAFANRLGLPWCVVPCCVYSKLFTKRRIKDGSIVRTHEQLVQWLCETNPNARVATLGFEGKNKVIYTLPREED